MTRHVLLLFCSVVFLSACYRFKPHDAFDPAQTPPAPDYARLECWAAHPEKNDPADRVPIADLHNEQATASVDVFFLYPTTLTGNHKSERRWNGDVYNKRLNEKTDSSSILFQASLFNSAGRVFAPRFRQAHLDVFFGKDKASAAQAIEVSYEDVLAAFDYYIKNWNQGRPFILAGHSQGGLHILSLLRERIENTPLEKQLVVAYIAGWPIRRSDLKKIQPCETPEQLGCYCSWRTWERKSGKKRAKNEDYICTNPLTWSIEEGQYASKQLNKGGVVRPFNHVYPNITDAEVYNGYLLADRPKFKGSVFFRKKNYHVGDLNLYYLNVRENAELRAQMYLQRR